MDFIKELIETPLEKVWNTMEKSIKQIVSNRILEYQIEEYQRNFYTKTILHRTEPVKLADFYQPLFIRRYGRNYTQERISTEDCKTLFNSSQFITLLGTAGSGKSTIIKYLVVNSIETRFKIPIKVELRYLNNYGGNLHKYIEMEIFKRDQLAYDKSIINKLLHSGQFLFFFDGYDELSSLVKENITKDINDFSKLYNKNYYLLTSRPYTNIELLSKYKNYEVCELSKSEMISFVEKQIKEKEVINKIAQSIEDSNNQTYISYLRNPLLLSMFILTFQTYSNVPPKKSAFYRQVFDSLFYLHDSVSKLSWTRERKSKLSKEEFEHILKLFSFISYFKEVFIFDSDFLNATFNQIKENKKSLDFDNLLLLDDLQVAVCILNKEGLDYVFPHRSLQEYFASLYIVGLEKNNKKEVYKKILKQFNSNEMISETFFKENFYSLLVEQDYLGIIEYLTIPYLEKINDFLKGPLNKEDVSSVLIFLQLFLFIFHSDNKFVEQSLGSLSEYHAEKSNFLRKKISSNNSISLLKEDEQHLVDIEQKLIKILKLSLPKIIKQFKEYLKQENQSDTSIIDLI